VEVGNVLRRAVRSGEVGADTGAIAHAEFQALPIDLLPYVPVASRAWGLRDNLTLYDAWYVALAELLGAALATLDGRLARAPGPTCKFFVRTR